jgi:hypothetical protein
MEQQVQNKPKRILRRTPKINITSISPILKTSEDIKKTTKKLRRTFERRTYLKGTHLSVLNRYKKRLDSIERAQEEQRQRASRKKYKAPDIKKFAGKFFAPGSSDDPFKAIGSLAAFNALTSFSEGKVLDALTPALIAAGMFAGPGLIGAGISKIFDRGSKPTTGVDVSGRRVPKSAQQRYLSRYGEKAFRSRFGNQALKNLQKPDPSITPKGTSIGARTSKAFSRLGKSIIPGVGAVFGGIDAELRRREGDYTGAAISGASAALDAATAASAATGIGLVAAPFLGIASIALDLVNFTRDIIGMSEKESERNKTKINKPSEDKIKERLKEQTKLQKEQVSQIDKKEPEGTLSFSQTLIGYDRVVTKFEKFSESFKIQLPEEDPDYANFRASEVERTTGLMGPVDEPGYEFTKYLSQYLTGDPDSPSYDYYHGTVSNYHDHLAFKDRETAIRAYEFLKSKGLDVTELTGFGAGVTGPHSGAGSMHHSGLAFDVPGYQWQGSGPIGEREFRGSRLVRQYMNEFFKNEIERDKKKTAPKPTPKPTLKGQPKGYGKVLNNEYFYLDGKYWERKDNSTKEIDKETYKAIRDNHRTGFGLPSYKDIPLPSEVSIVPQKNEQIARSIETYPTYDNKKITVPLPIINNPGSEQIAMTPSSPGISMPSVNRQNTTSDFFKKILLNELA